MLRNATNVSADAGAPVLHPGTFRFAAGPAGVPEQINVLLSLRYSSPGLLSKITWWWFGMSTHFMVVVTGSGTLYLVAVLGSSLCLNLTWTRFPCWAGENVITSVSHPASPT